MDKNKILVPDLLEKGEPVFDFDYTRALKFRISYDFLPQSVMPRFIVRNHMDIKDKLNWRTGVVLENKGFNAVAVVKADHREKLIHIYVDGVLKRDYFAVLLNTFREINRSFEHIEWDEGVPLPDNPAIAVNYHHLLRLEGMGEPEYFPEKAERKYNVKALLDGIKPEKERQKEVDQLLRDGKVEIIVQQPPPPVIDAKPGGFWQKTLRICMVIATVIGLLAALIGILVGVFALLDSGSFNEFIKNLFSK